jgi:hypothetical protein
MAAASASDSSGQSPLEAYGEEVRESPGTCKSGEATILFCIYMGIGRSCSRDIEAKMLLYRGDTASNSRRCGMSCTT